MDFWFDAVKKQKALEANCPDIVQTFLIEMASFRRDYSLWIERLDILLDHRRGFETLFVYPTPELNNLYDPGNVADLIPSYELTSREIPEISDLQEKLKALETSLREGEYLLMIYARRYRKHPTNEFQITVDASGEYFDH